MESHDSPLSKITKLNSAIRSFQAQTCVGALTLYCPIKMEAQNLSPESWPPQATSLKSN